MSEFQFPQKFTPVDIDQAICSASIVKYQPSGLVDWRKTSFVISIDGTDFQPSAIDLIAIFAAHPITVREAVRLFEKHGLTIKETYMSHRFTEVRKGFRLANYLTTRRKNQPTLALATTRPAVLDGAAP